MIRNLPNVDDADYFRNPYIKRAVRIANLKPTILKTSCYVVFENASHVPFPAAHVPCVVSARTRTYRVVWNVASFKSFKQFVICARIRN